MSVLTLHFIFLQITKFENMENLHNSIRSSVCNSSLRLYTATNHRKANATGKTASEIAASFRRLYILVNARHFRNNNIVQFYPLRNLNLLFFLSTSRSYLPFRRLFLPHDVIRANLMLPKSTLVPKG